jgi:hypothetical protein
MTRASGPLGRRVPDGIRLGMRRGVGSDVLGPYCVIGPVATHPGRNRLRPVDEVPERVSTRRGCRSPGSEPESAAADVGVRAPMRGSTTPRTIPGRGLEPRTSPARQAARGYLCTLIRTPQPAGIHRNWPEPTGTTVLSRTPPEACRDSGMRYQVSSRPILSTNWAFSFPLYPQDLAEPAYGSLHAKLTCWSGDSAATPCSPWCNAIRMLRTG